jgi:hypothetical protein
MYQDSGSGRRGIFCINLIPLPIAIGTLLLKEKGCKNHISCSLAPLLKERGWGEVYGK